MSNWYRNENQVIVKMLNIKTQALYPKPRKRQVSWMAPEQFSFARLPI
jgi:hypothetical protein